MPNITWDINLGSLILAMVGVAAGYASFYYGTKASITSLSVSLTTFGATLEAGMGRLEKTTETMGKVVMDLALSTQRQDNFEKHTNDEFSRVKDDIKDLKLGRGLIREVSSRGG